MRAWKSLLFLTFLFVGARALAFTHVSPSAETLAPGQVAFQPYPGSNPIQDYAFLTNSLSVGLWDGWEIGTVPLMWQSTESYSLRNFNWKNRLWRSQEWTVAWGTQHLFYDSKGEMRELYDSFRVDQIGFGVEYRPLSSRFQFRYNLATSQMVIQGMSLMRLNDGTNYRMSTWYVGGGVDHYLDIAYAASETNGWILGMSQNHEWLSGLGARDAAAWGLGLSHAWKIKGRWISGLSLGFHARERTGAKMLASVVF